MPPPEKPQNNDGIPISQPLKPWEQGYRFDLNGQDGAILTGDGLTAKVEGAPGILNNNGNADAHLPEATIDEKPKLIAEAFPHWQAAKSELVAPSGTHEAESLNRSFIDPTLRAFSARFAYLAATDGLTADNASIARTLKKAGPLGEQLLGQMAEMEKFGWKLQPIGLNDRYLQLERPNLLSRMSKMLTLSGYHYDTFKGENLRAIGYNNVNNALGSVMGSSYGTGNTIKHVTSIVAHEIGHHDKTIADFRDISKLTVPEQQTLAKRLLATETRAILTQLHVADKVGDFHLSNDSLRTALMKRDLGGFIHDAWGKSSSTYSSFGAIDRQYAKTFVNEFIDDLSVKTQAKFNNPLVDAKTGRVGLFDIAEGAGNRFGNIAGDEEVLRRMSAPVAQTSAAPGRFAAFMESKTGRVLGYGMKGAAALGLLATAADLKSAYSESFSKGNSRLARVGVDWAGFEAGTVLGSRLASALAVSAKVKLPVVAIPLAAISFGIGGSYLADKTLGEGVENYVGRKFP
ncbi:MAG: hypothetical protein DKT66_02585 [Candidatus Melainabacteria bacterium]|nr:MAG: hypothetical protein DKT66_02585 [Candidatus Melainabacteria bacterium]